MLNERTTDMWLSSEDRQREKSFLNHDNNIDNNNGAAHSVRTVGVETVRTWTPVMGLLLPERVWSTSEMTGEPWTIDPAELQIADSEGGWLLSISVKIVLTMVLSCSGGGR